MEASLRSTANTDAMSNLLLRFVMHGSVFLKAAEARLAEYNDALTWFDEAISIRERLAPETTSELLEHIGSARRAFEHYIKKPAYRELLKDSMPGVYAECGSAVAQVLETLYKRALAEWLALVCAFMSDRRRAEGRAEEAEAKAKEAEAKAKGRKEAGEEGGAGGVVV